MFYRFVRAVVCVLSRVFFRFQIVGADLVPAEGRLILCANHTNILDVPFLAACTRRSIVFMAKKELFRSRLSRFLLGKLRAIPVNRDGNDAYSLKCALTALKEEKVLGIFPEGTRQHNRDGKMIFKPGVSMLAIKTQTPVVPVYIKGNYRLFCKMTAIIGEPIELSSYYGKKLTGEDYVRIANEEIAGRLVSLKEENITFRR